MTYDLHIKQKEKIHTVIQNHDGFTLIKESSLKPERGEVNAGHGNCKCCPRGEDHTGRTDCIPGDLVERQEKNKIIKEIVQ